MLYCTRCRMLFSGDTCPECGSLGRTPQREDYCLLTEQPGIFAKMLLDVLDQEGIPTAFRATQGAVGIFSNMDMELYRIYVPLAHLERAASLRDGLLGPDGGDGEETEEDAQGETPRA